MKQANRRIFLSPPHMSGSEQKYISEAFDQNWIAPLGPSVDAFEADLAKYCGVAQSAALSSGTAAIHLALSLLGVGQGDEVIVSTFTFSASVNPVLYVGASPVFIDSEKDTWNMDPVLLEKALADRTMRGRKQTVKAIIVVHLYGMPAKMNEIMELANRYGVPVIEDAAEAMGSRYCGRPLGSIGKLGVLSFNGNKIITTSGGGALLSDSSDLISKARFLASQARDPAPHYEHSEVGYNYRMSNILAGIGRGQMEVIDERVRKKRENYQMYLKLLEGLKGITFQEEPGKAFFSNRWLTTILIDSKKAGTDNENIRKQLESNNIEARPLWKPMHRQPVFSKYASYVNRISDDLFGSGLCLPSGSDLELQDIKRIVKIITTTVRKKLLVKSFPRKRINQVR